MNYATYSQTSTGTAGLSINNLTVTAATAFNLNLTGGITLRGNLAVNAGTLTLSPASANTLTLAGTTLQRIAGSGTLTIGNTTNVVVASAAIVEVDRTLTLGGNLTINGVLQFDPTTTQTLTLTGNLGGTGTLDMSGGDLSHQLNLAGTANSITTFTTSATGNSTVTYMGSGNQAVFVSTNYVNLTTAGSGTKSLPGNAGPANVISGNLTINAGSAFDAVARTLLVGNTTTVWGSFADSNSGGTNQFTGAITINTGGAFSSANSSPFIFNGGITNNGTFSSSRGTQTFSVNTQLLAGTKSILFNGPTLIDKITLTNQNTETNAGVIWNSTLNGTDASAVFDNRTIAAYRNAALPMLTGVLKADQSGNTFKYDNGNQAVLGTTYHNLYVSGNTKTLAGDVTVNNELSIWNYTSLQVATYDLTVKNKTYLPLSGKLLDNATAGVTTLNTVDIARGSSIDGGSGGNVGVFIITGTFTTTGQANEPCLLGAASVTLTGQTTIEKAGLSISSILGDKTFNNITLQSPIASTIGWSNTVNEPITITGNVSISSGMPFTAGDGMYTFTGTTKTIASAIALTIPNATFTGTYTATGTDIQITNATISPAAGFVNNTTTYPVVMPSSATIRAFNNSTLAFVNKFDRFTCTANAGNNIASSNGTDLRFTRTAGSVYAVRTRSLSPVPTAVKITFQLSAINNSVSSTSNAAALLIGNNVGDNAIRTTAAAWLQFNLETTNNKASVTIPGSASPSSSNNSNQTFTWVINRSGSTISYTTPNAFNQTLNNGTAELWLGGTLLGSFPMQNTSQDLSQLKFIMDQGNSSITLLNLQINPIATIATNAFASTCISAGNEILVSYNFNEYTLGTLAGNRAQSINEGSEIYVQLSDKDGNFNTNYYNNYVMTRRDKASAALSPNDLLLSGSVSVQIPEFATGPGYRYRVVISESGDTRPNMVSTSQPLFISGSTASIYYIAPSIPQSFLFNQTGNTLTVTTPVAASSYQWFYRSASDGTNTKYPIAGRTTSTYAPRGLDFGTQGTYYVSCQVTYSPCSNVYTNEVVINIVCSNGTNLVKNGNFNNYIVGTAQNVVINKGVTKISGNATSFTKDLRPGRRLYALDNTFLGVVDYIVDDVTIYLSVPDGVKANYNSTSFITNYNEIPLQGTITTSTGSLTVIGVGTQFVGQLKPGYLLGTNTGTLIGTVASITDNTTLTLTGNAAIALSGSIYKTNADHFLYPGTISASTSSKIVTGLNTTFSVTNGGVVKQIESGDIIRIIDRNNSTTIIELGTVASVQSATQLTLTSNSLASVSNAYYVANPPQFGTSGSQFNTEYRYTSWNMYPEGNFVVGINPNYYHDGFCSMTLESQRSSSIGGSGGNMLVANASNNSTQKVWSQSISGLEINTNYVLTFNAVSLAGAANSLIFGAYINCSRVGDDITADYTTNCQWRKYSILVNSGNLTSLELSIANISATAAGNDVAIDDITLFKCPEVVTVPFPQIVRFRWRGYDNNWFSSDNWGVCPGVLPTCSDDIEIPIDVPYYPIITSTEAAGRVPVARTIKVNTGASVTINPDINLNVCGDITNDGTINSLTTGSTAAKVSFIGYGSASIPPSPLPVQQQIKTNSSSPFGEVLVNQSPVLTGGVSLLTNVVINKQLDIQTNNSLVLNTNTLTLNGTLANSTGTITGNTATSRVTIGGTGSLDGPLRFTGSAPSLGYLTLNRIGGQVTLGTSLSLIGGVNALTLTNGLLNTTATNLLTLSTTSTVTGSSARISGGSNNSHINGPMAKVFNSTAPFTFPVGNLGYLGEVGLESINTNTNTFTASYVRQNPYSFGSTLASNLHHITKLEYWNLDRVGSSDTKVSLHWTDYSDVGVDANAWKELRVAHYNSSTKIWENKGPGTGIGTNSVVQNGVSNSKGYVTSDWVSNFSPFTLGTSVINNPLPVVLLNFKAYPNTENVKLSWATVNERNSDYFEVERSLDGKNFVSIGKVKATGESKVALSYSLVDAAPGSINYYRLNTVDKDYQHTYSKVIIVYFDGKQSSSSSIEVFPNPFDGTSLFLQTDLPAPITISFTNILGIHICEETLDTNEGLIKVTPKTKLSPGTYIMTLRSANRTSQLKIVVR
jgi:hypothetical protein